MNKVELHDWLNSYLLEIKKRDPNKIGQLWPESVFLKSKFIQVLRIEWSIYKITIFLLDFKNLKENQAFSIYRFNLDEGFEKLENFLENNKFYIINGLDEFQQNLFSKRIKEEIINSKRNYQPEIISGTYIPNGDLILTWFGDIENKNIQEYLDARYNKVKTENIIESSENLDEKKENKEVLGLSIIITPKIWIGEEPNPTFEDEFLNKSIDYYDSIIINVKFCGKLLILKKSGFIFLECENKEVFLQKINFILAIVNLYGNIDVFPQKFFQINESVYNNYAFSIRRSIIRTNYEKVEFFDTNPYSFWRFSINRRKIEESKMHKLLEIAEILSNDIKLGILLRFYLEQYGHHANSEYSQSFIIGWTTLEQIIEEKWIKFLNEMNVTGDRKKILKDHRQWYVSHQIEVLTFHNILNSEQYSIISKFRKIRNDFIHKTSEISQVDSLDLLIFLGNQLKEKILKEYRSNKHFLDSIDLKE